MSYIIFHIYVLACIPTLICKLFFNKDSSRRDNLKKYLVEFEEMIKTQLAKDNDKAEIISS